MTSEQPTSEAAHDHDPDHARMEVERPFRNALVALIELNEVLHGRPTVPVADARALAGELPQSLTALDETELRAIAEQLRPHHGLTAAAVGGREISALRERLRAAQDASRTATVPPTQVPSPHLSAANGVVRPLGGLSFAVRSGYRRPMSLCPVVPKLLTFDRTAGRFARSTEQRGTTNA